MELEILAEELRQAKAFRDEFINDKACKATLKLYRAQYSEKLQPINLVFSTTRGMLPYVYFQNPKVQVVARSGDFLISLATPLVQALASLLMEKLDLKQKVRAMSLDNSITGTCIAKLGSNAAGALPKSLQSTKELTPLGLGKGAQFPWVSPVFAQDFLVPKRTIRQYSSHLTARWCAHRLIYKRSELLGMKGMEFRKQGVKEAPAVDLQYPDDSFSRAQSVIDPILSAMTRLRRAIAAKEGKTKLERDEKANEHIVVWEVWDAQAEKLLWLASDADMQEMVVLREGTFKLSKLPLRALPFVSACYNQDPKYFWGVSDTALIAPQQKEATMLRTRLSLLVRLQTLRLLYQEGMIDPNELEKLWSEEPLAGLPVKGNPKDIIMQFNIDIPQALPNVINMNRMDIREVLGFGENQSGEFHSGRRTATEVNAVQTGSMARMDDKRSLMADLITSILRYALGVVFETWKEEVTLPLVIPNPDGTQQVKLVKFKWSDLQADYDFKLNFDDALPFSKVDKFANAQMLSQMLQAIPEVSQPAVANYILEQVGAEVKISDFQIDPQPVGLKDLVSQKKKQNA